MVQYFMKTEPEGQNLNTPLPECNHSPNMYNGISVSPRPALFVRSLVNCMQIRPVDQMVFMSMF